MPTSTTSPCVPPLKVASFPYGWYTAIPFVLSLVAMIMVAVGGFSCDMFKLKEDASTASVAVGYTGVNYNDDCRDYSETTYEPGSPIQAGKAFSIIVTVFGVLLVAFMIMLTFVRFPTPALLSMAVTAFVLAAFSAIVVGVFFAEDICTRPGISCQPASMMYVVLVGLLFWIGAGVALLQVKNFERAGLDGERVAEGDHEHDAASSAKDTHGAGSVTSMEEVPSTIISTIVNPDGTKTRTTTVTHYEDGQKIVENVTEQV